MKPIIEICQLGKKYRIRKAAPYLSLRDSITRSLTRAFKKKIDRQLDFWALKDINLKIERGERLGIIGRNGAGKSTLLKILSRITWPTEGEATIRGRLASLLEVGTGFHPELTGRENVYLNGSILGLKKSAIDRQFDSIVDFSGISEFLDTSLKNYSTGMQLRLAFSVAAHLEPEILMIDEVLAVGDMEFQKKCLGKMEEVSNKEGRTIVFVSHNMAALEQLCSKGILIEKGRLISEGPISNIISAYTGMFSKNINRTAEGKFDISKHQNKINDSTGLLSADLYVNDRLSEDFIPGSSITIDVTYKIDALLIDPEIGIVIKDRSNTVFIGLNNKHLGQKLNLKTGKKEHAIITIPKLNIFSSGRYTVDLFFGDAHHFYECLYNCFDFTVIGHDIYKTGVLLNPDLNKIYIEDITIQA